MVPVIMCALLIIGGLVIMAGYLAFEASRWASVGLITMIGTAQFRKPTKELTPLILAPLSSALSRGRGVGGEGAATL